MACRVASEAISQARDFGNLLPFTRLQVAFARVLATLVDYVHLFMDLPGASKVIAPATRSQRGAAATNPGFTTIKLRVHGNQDLKEPFGKETCHMIIGETERHKDIEYRYLEYLPLDFVETPSIMGNKESLETKDLKEPIYII